MRVGNNPNRMAASEKLNEVVLLAITHLPNLTGYHAGRLEIVQTCLNTMRQNAGDVRVSIAVWDNGSCQELRSWLHNEYEPDMLIETNKLGKATVRGMFAHMLQPGTVMMVTDDDMLFAPDYLRPQLDLLQSFPNVAAVSGYPVRTQFRWGCRNTVAWAQKNATVKVGRFIPEQWERDFCASIEREYDWHKKQSENDMDYLVEWHGKTAFLTAHHCQLLCYPSDVLRAFPKYVQDAMGDEKPFDNAMDKLGLRLTTTSRLVRHMGNVMDDEIRNAAALALIGAINPGDIMEFQSHTLTENVKHSA